MPRRDYYAVLGVKRNATAEEIKRSYRSLAKQYHPDRNPDDLDAERRFREAVEAYDTLSDPEKRARYDRLGPLYRPDGRPPTPDDLGAFVSDTLSGLFRKRKDDHGEDLRYTLAIALEDVARGGTRTVEVRRMVRCEHCRGNGADPDGGTRDCSACSGSGRASTRRLFRSECPRCDGTGTIVIKVCSRCEGQCRHERNDDLKIRIPHGVGTGQKLKIQGKGNVARGNGDPGDLYVLIEVSDHPLFQRRGTDLLCEVPITLAQAALGADVNVPTLQGQTTIRIPAGTPSDKVFRIAGRGIAALGESRKGDLHARMVVEVPTELSEEQRDLLKMLDEKIGLEAHPRRRAYVETMSDRQ